MRILSALTLTLSLVLTSLASPRSSHAESANELVRSARGALTTLYETTPGASNLGKQAVGILVFPAMVEGGFVFAAQYGNGVLFKGNSVAGYYNSSGGSFGFQAGAQKFSYALFFMTENDLSYLNKSAGWEIGAGPNITVLDQGFSGSFSSTTARKGVYAFVFSQTGLMGGVSLQGTKITKIKKP